MLNKILHIHVTRVNIAYERDISPGENITKVFIALHVCECVSIARLSCRIFTLCLRQSVYRIQ